MNRKRLPNFIIEAGRANLIEVNRVGLAQYIETLLRDHAQAANGEAWPLERMATHHLFRQSQLAPDVAYFVLEQLAQRLDQLKLHVRLEPAHVVMRLDRRRRSA